MMKKVLMIAILFLLSFSGFAQTYCRPVKVKFDEKEFAVDDNSTKIRLFVGEWFETREGNNADAKIITDKERWLQTDGDSAALDIAQKDDVNNHKPIEVSSCKTSDSLYIKVPKADDSNWFYVIDQDNNKKIGKKGTESFDQWIAIPLDDNKMKVFRISPENHVVSFIKLNEIEETKVDTIQEGDSCFECLVLNVNDTIFKQSINPTQSGSDGDGKMSVITIVLIVLLGLSLIVAAIVGLNFFKKRQRVDPKNQQTVLCFSKCKNEPKGKRKAEYEQKETFPNPPLEKGQKVMVKNGSDYEYYEVKEYIISKDWKELTEYEEYEMNGNEKPITFPDLRDLAKCSPQVGDVVKVQWFDGAKSKRKSGFRYWVFGELKKTTTTSNPVNNNKPSIEIVSIKKKTLIQLLDTLPAEFVQLKEQLLEQHKQEMKESVENEKKLNAKLKALEDKDNEMEKQRRELESREKTAQDNAKEAKKKYDELKESFDKKVEEKVAKEKKEAKDKVDKAKKDAQIRIQKAERERNEALEKRDSIKKELTDKFDKEKERLEEAKKDAENRLEKTKSSLNATTQELTSTTKQLQDAHSSIKRLENAQTKFTNVLTYVPFAENYSRKVNDFIEIVGKIYHAANKLLDVESVKDPYHIMKTLAKYAKAMEQIDLAQLYTEVKMITQGQMVLRGTTLSTYNQNSDKEQLSDSLKIYFFDTYLARYIEAVTILNETCLGLDRLVDGLSSKDVKEFQELREQLQSCVSRLDVDVETVHLFDKVGQKIDLRVTLVDAGFSTGDILEIENCYVYLRGTNRPDTKIFVKAQS